ncbi:Uncharacterised protein [Vibrio cholerae]|nr:Uncharacterised protein [Vibrio cholerae]
MCSGKLNQCPIQQGTQTFCRSFSEFQSHQCNPLVRNQIQQIAQDAQSLRY